MNADDRAVALRVLRHLCAGAQIDGVRFGPIPQILIGQHEPHLEVQGQVYVNLSDAWSVFPSRPDPLPPDESGYPEADPAAEVALICSVAEQKIRDVTIGEQSPHLVFELESGQVLVVNGHHDQYESWQLGVSYCPDTWLVVACPGDGIAVWAPEEFLRPNSPAV